MPRKEETEKVFRVAKDDGAGGGRRKQKFSRNSPVFRRSDLTTEERPSIAIRRRRENTGVRTGDSGSEKSI